MLRKHCCTRGGQFECKTLLLWQPSRCRVLNSRSCPYLLHCKGPPGCGCLAAMGHLAACDLGGGVERCGMHQLKVSVVQCQMAMGRTVCTNLANFYLWWFREVWRLITWKCSTTAAIQALHTQGDPVIHEWWMMWRRTWFKWNAYVCTYVHTYIRTHACLGMYMPLYVHCNHMIGLQCKIHSWYYVVNVV